MYIYINKRQTTNSTKSVTTEQAGEQMPMPARQRKRGNRMEVLPEAYRYCPVFVKVFFGHLLQYAQGVIEGDRLQQNFLPMVQGLFGFGSIVHLWGFLGVSGLSRPHALATLSKNPLGFRHRGIRGFACGSVAPSEIGPNGARPGF